MSCLKLCDWYHRRHTAHHKWNFHFIGYLQFRCVLWPWSVQINFEVYFRWQKKIKNQYGILPTNQDSLLFACATTLFKVHTFLMNSTLCCSVCVSPPPPTLLWVEKTTRSRLDEPTKLPPRHEALELTLISNTKAIHSKKAQINYSNLSRCYKTKDVFFKGASEVNDQKKCSDSVPKVECSAESLQTNLNYMKPWKTKRWRCIFSLCRNRTPTAWKTQRQIYFIITDIKCNPYLSRLV